MRQVPLERDINIAINGCSGFATSTQKGPFTAMLISHSRGTYLIGCRIIVGIWKSILVMHMTFLSCGCVEGGALCSRRLSIEHEQHVCGIFTPFIEKSTSLDILRFHLKSMTNVRKGRKSF